MPMPSRPTSSRKLTFCLLHGYDREAAELRKRMRRMMEEQDDDKGVYVGSAESLQRRKPARDCASWNSAVAQA